MIDNFAVLKTQVANGDVKGALITIAELELRHIETKTEALTYKTRLLEKETQIILLVETLRAIAYKTDEELSMINGKSAADLAAKALLALSNGSRDGAKTQS